MVAITSYRAGVALVAALAYFSGLIAADGPDGEQCGPKNGNAKCGMNTCCSPAGYCGTTDPYCGSNCNPSFGSCGIPAVPSCAASAKSATGGRRVGYWAVQQAHDRGCDKVLPSQINKASFSHLVLSFAHIDPNSFAVVPADSADVPFYTQFTSLQTSALKTWIAIGGGGFSVATWSAMAATSSSRAAFISSLTAFMKKYNFQGVDLDWEFPNASGVDASRLVALVKELRTALGTSYGISAALPADWGSVRGFDAAGMAPSMDFFNFMAYDIHGIGIDGQKVLQYPASISDIATGLQPLWASKIPGRQINLGLPLYGRGYTLASASCKTVSTSNPCSATGPSQSGACVKDSNGVMSLNDIRKNNPTVTFDRTAMQKIATWGSNQWVAFDDAETLALKMAWADLRCIGGAMFWAVDHNAGTIN